MKHPNDQCRDLARLIVTEQISHWDKHGLEQPTAAVDYAIRVLIACKGGRRWMQRSCPSMLYEPYYFHGAGLVRDGYPCESFIQVTRKSTPIFLTLDDMRILVRI